MWFNSKTQGGRTANWWRNVRIKPRASPKPNVLLSFALAPDESSGAYESANTTESTDLYAPRLRRPPLGERALGTGSIRRLIGWIIYRFEFISRS